MGHPPQPSTPQNCFICKNEPTGGGGMQLTCAGVEAGEVGNTGCSLRTNGMTVTFCEGVDEVCQFINIT